MNEGTLPAQAVVAHLSRAARVPLAQVLGGSEPTHMTPSLAAEISVLDEPLACWMVSDSSTMEINLLDRYLDILATAELPGTGEQIQVAIENQYGTADPDHFGRLVGWYMPETGAQMGVLVAEAFDPQLIKAVSDGAIIRPEHGLSLVEACGYIVRNSHFVTYTTRASSLPRADLEEWESELSETFVFLTSTRERPVDERRLRAFDPRKLIVVALWEHMNHLKPNTKSWIKENQVPFIQTRGTGGVLLEALRKHFPSLDQMDAPTAFRQRDP